jgi:signal transduction histidine kinase
VSAIYAWLRRHQILVDSVLAGVLALFAAGQMWADPALQVPMTLLLVVPVAVRRKVPVTAYAIAQAAALWQIATNELSGAVLAVLVLLYTVAAYRPRRVSVTVLCVSLSGSGVAGLIFWTQPGLQLSSRLFVAGVMFGGSALTAWVLGDSMRYRRGYYAALEDRAARLEAERDAQSKVAAAAERARIARELHDVIAHHVSVMVVQADGAAYALRSDPETTQTALRAISRTGRQALNEMRNLLGVLRTDGDRAQLAPVPGLGELRELLDQARSAGLAVTYTLSGTPRDLPEGAELAAYRVVQESLTNTRKHAGLAASAAVTLRYEPAGLTVEVTDDGLASSTPGSGGHGLAGMRERIEMYGGTVRAGPLEGGGFGVVAHLPCAQAAGRQSDTAARPVIAGALGAGGAAGRPPSEAAGDAQTPASTVPAGDAPGPASTIPHSTMPHSTIPASTIPASTIPAGSGSERR